MFTILRKLINIEKSDLMLTLALIPPNHKITVLIINRVFYVAEWVQVLYLWDAHPKMYRSECKVLTFQIIT